MLSIEYGRLYRDVLIDVRSSVYDIFVSIACIVAIFCVATRTGELSTLHI